MNRRDFARCAGALSAWAMLMPESSRLWRRPAFTAYPFALGVASGDPTPDGVVLWTRLAPDPLRGGGMPREPVPVRWEVAADDRLAKGVKRGTTIASPDWAHSVHVEVAGLQPGRPYWYRFNSGGEASPLGRTRTAPPPTASPKRLRFAFASCQHYEHGYYTAFRHLAAEDLDLVFHLGDYIYEYKGDATRVRMHTGDEIQSLDDYRSRYALYKMDPDLQAAHATFPGVLTWDDHEVDNDYAGLASENRDPAEAFRERRAAAYRARITSTCRSGPLRFRMAPSRRCTAASRSDRWRRSSCSTRDSTGATSPARRASRHCARRRWILRGPCSAVSRSAGSSI